MDYANNLVVTLDKVEAMRTLTHAIQHVSSYQCPSVRDALDAVEAENILTARIEELLK